MARVQVRVRVLRVRIRVICIRVRVRVRVRVLTKRLESESESLEIWTRVRLEYTVGLEYYITANLQECPLMVPFTLSLSNDLIQLKRMKRNLVYIWLDSVDLGRVNRKWPRWSILHYTCASWWVQCFVVRSRRAVAGVSGIAVVSSAAVVDFRRHRLASVLCTTVHSNGVIYRVHSVRVPPSRFLELVAYPVTFVTILPNS